VISVTAESLAKSTDNKMTMTKRTYRVAANQKKMKTTTQDDPIK